MSNNSVNKRYVPKLRFKGFEGEYSFEILNKYLEYEQPTKYLILNNENINEIGNVPVLTANKSFILGYVENELNNCYKKGECFIFDDFTTDIKYVNFLFKLRSSAAKIITTKNDNHINYFFYLLKSKKPETLGHKRHWIEITSKEKRFIPPTLKEQEKISIFLSLLDKQISLLENKLKLTEQMKEYYKNFIFKLFFQHSKKQEFNKIFKKYKLFANDETLKQVTIGKTGLNIINKTNYKINNHKLIEINSLIIGIGIEEINFNLNLEKICCSPIYQTYRLNDEFNNIFICYFISEIISKNRNLITKKSTRREYEVIIKDLEKLKIPIPNSREQYKFGNLMLDLDLMIQKLNNKIKLMKKRKLFYLNNLFI